MQAWVHMHLTQMNSTAKGSSKESNNSNEENIETVTNMQDDSSV